MTKARQAEGLGLSGQCNIKDVSTAPDSGMPTANHALLAQPKAAPQEDREDVFGTVKAIMRNGNDLSASAAPDSGMPEEPQTFKMYRGKELIEEHVVTLVDYSRLRAYAISLRGREGRGHD